MDFVGFESFNDGGAKIYLNPNPFPIATFADVVGCASTTERVQHDVAWVG